MHKTLETSDVFLANNQYINSFTEPLFLHKNVADTHVNLDNLFVLQKYQFIRAQEEAPCNDLEDLLANFLHQDDSEFLFIEGDAGCGKTTLAAWMNYHFSLGDHIANHLFDNRPLLTIRLRDIDKEALVKNRSLSYAIRKYMNVSSLDELERLFPNAVMLLDGFDELCMIEGLGYNHEEMLYDLHKKNLCGFKFIVTTRPKFISYGIDIPSIYISLQHFDAEQRAIWLDRYTSDIPVIATPQTVPSLPVFLLVASRSTILPPKASRMGRAKLRMTGERSNCSAMMARLPTTPLNS